MRRLLLCLALLVPATASAAPPNVETQDAADTGSLPKGVTISPDGRRLYVSNYGISDRHNIGVYDASTLGLLHHIDVPGVVVETAISPDGKTLYASNFKRNAVQFIDLVSRQVTREVKAGAHPKILVVSHDGKRLFAANWGNESVSVIDSETGKVLHTLRTEKNPRGMAVTRSGRLYVANFTDDSIDVYEGANFEVHKRLHEICRIPRHLTLSPDESRLYISCLYANQLAVMDTAALKIVKRVGVGRAPKANDVTRDGRYVVTADYRGSTVTVVDTTDWSTRVLEVPGMIAASGITAARPARGKKGYPLDQTLRVFVTGWYDNHVYSVGLAGARPAYQVDQRVAEHTAKMRNYYRAHPVE